MLRSHRCHRPAELGLHVFACGRAHRGLNTAAGGALGILLGGLLIFFLEYWDAGILRTRADVERQLNLAVLGAIPAVSSSTRAGR